MAGQGVHTRLVNYNQILGHVADQDYMEFIDYIDRYRSHPEYLYLLVDIYLPQIKLIVCLYQILLIVKSDLFNKKI